MSHSPIDGIALEQLAGYQTVAIDWPRYPDGRAVRCGKCDQSIWFAYDINGTPYVYEDHELLALKVAHIRQVHPEATNGNE